MRRVNCIYCHREIKLRESGGEGVYGTLWKHRRPGADGMAEWCEGGGEPPPPTRYLNTLGLEPGMGLPRERRRVPCLVCHREIMQMANGWLYRHYDGNGAVCEGSGTDPGQDGRETGWGDNTDNAGYAVSGGYWPDPAPALTLTLAHPGGGAAGLELAEWWANTALSEIGMVVAKAIEYGATDLRDLGYQMLEMAGRRPTPDPEHGDDQEYWDGYATEVGIVFYAQGKLARIVAAIKEGRRPKVDSWLDLGIYSRMAQRVQQVGGWPHGRT